MDNCETVDRRVRRSQTALMDALSTLLQTKSLPDISVNAVTKMADVNRSTFYAHYIDKYDLFHAVVRARFEAHLRERLPRPQEMHIARLKDVIVATCEFFGPMSHNCAPHQKELDPIIETEVQRLLNDYLLAWIQSNGEAADTASWQAIMLSWTIFGAGVEYRHHRNGRDPQDIAETVYHLLSQPIVRAQEE